MKASNFKPETDTVMILKRDVAAACGVSSPRVLRSLIAPLISSNAIFWDMETRPEGGRKGGKKLISRSDFNKILVYLKGEE